MPTCPNCGTVFTETVPVPPIDIRPFPNKILFEDTSSQGTDEYKGTAVVLFPQVWEGRIISVTMNGEKCQKGVSYKGQPVFRLLKTGDKYTRPLNFVIEAITGTYSYTIAADPVAPSGGRSETVKNAGQANGNRSHFRFSKKVAEYGTFSFSFDGGPSYKVTPADMNDGRHEPGGGKLVKSPDNRGHTAILGEYGKVYKTCTIKY